MDRWIDVSHVRERIRRRLLNRHTRTTRFSTPSLSLCLLRVLEGDFHLLYAKQSFQLIFNLIPIENSFVCGNVTNLEHEYELEPEQFNVENKKRKHYHHCFPRILGQQLSIDRLRIDRFSNVIIRIERSGENNLKEIMSILDVSLNGRTITFRCNKFCC